MLFCTSNPDWFMVLPQREVNNLSKSSEMKMKHIQPSCDSQKNDTLFLGLLNKMFCCVKTNEH